MKNIMIVIVLVSLFGCVGGRYVHPTMNQDQVNVLAFECRYRAEVMSQSYKSLYSAIDFADKYDQCLRAHGFIKQ